MFRVGFDNDLYIQKQSEQISKRIKEFGGKLYLRRLPCLARPARLQA